MRIDIITVLPKLLEGFFSDSILKRALKAGKSSIHLHNLREYGLGNAKQIDDYAFGGGAGMVMRPEPIFNLIEKLKTERKYDEIIYMCPDGKRFDQQEANYLALQENVLILCGHYKGVDERIRKHLITREISIGDYVLTGGEIAAAVVVDAVVRLLPGVLSDETSALTDSFQDGLLAPPVYTRPAEFNGWKVPDVLLSGHTKKIEEWRFEESEKRTQERRPDLLE